MDMYMALAFINNTVLNCVASMYTRVHPSNNILGARVGLSHAVAC